MYTIIYTYEFLIFTWFNRCCPAAGLGQVRGAGRAQDILLGAW